MYLWQKINLLLSGEWSVERITDGDISGAADICIIDKMSKGAERYVDAGGATITLGDGADLPLPFEHSALIRLLRGASVRKPPIIPGDRCVYLRGKKIPLTDVEQTLFNVLYKAGGEFVQRKSIVKQVWGSQVDGGVLNVYIHYLRAKLEKGEKIIISSRKFGYKIDSKFIKIEEGVS